MTTDAVLMLLRRDGTCLYGSGSARGPDGAAGGAPDEQARPYTDVEAARFRAVQRRLRQDSGADGDIDRVQGLNTDITAAGLPFLHRFVGLALAFHHATGGEDPPGGAGQQHKATKARTRPYGP
ncbi:hypothetical protein ACE1OC_00535 [Streptomyces sp. DSM 116496]|uniref:hypothetical protein n=1 Tax=Streptomyces stoeckheimensis TaxID=3344656 RepID=UPI0038B2D289